MKQRTKVRSVPAVDRARKPAVQRDSAPASSISLASRPLTADALALLDRSAILMLQRAAGNEGVTSLVESAGGTQGAAAAAPGPARPYIGPEAEGIMRQEIGDIVGMLKESWLSDSEQRQILATVGKYDELDQTYRAQTGYSGSDNLDRFLFLLKMRSYTSSSIGTMWVDQNYVAFDELWRALDGEALGEFKALVGKSQKQATSGPENADHENPWKTIGHQELVGGWGMLKGMGTGLAGLVDAGSFPVKMVTKTLREAGVDVADPASASDWVKSQFDESGEMMFGKDWAHGEELFAGMSAADIGTKGGGYIWTLTMAGAGGAGGTAGKALAAFGIAGNLKGIYDSGEKMADLILKMQEEGKLSAGELLTSGEFWTIATELGANIFGAISGAKTSSGEVAEATKAALGRAKLLIELTKVSAQVGRIVEIGASNMPDEEKKKAMGEAAGEIVNSALSMAADKAAEADAKAKAEAAAGGEEKTPAPKSTEGTEPQAAGAGGVGGGQRGGPGAGGGGPEGEGYEGLPPELLEPTRYPATGDQREGTLEGLEPSQSQVAAAERAARRDFEAITDEEIEAAVDKSHSPVMMEGPTPREEPTLPHAKRDTGVTVLGHDPYYRWLSDAAASRRLQIPDAAWNRMSRDAQWEANERFLDRTMERGDRIVLATPADEARPNSFFARELEYFRSKNWRPSASGYELLPPGTP